MDISKVSCNGCGAALEIPSGARFVTCRYCGANLEVKRTDSAIYTEVLDRIDQRTQAMAEDLEALRRGQELEQLDREWELRRQSLLVRGKHGTTSEPSAAGGIGTIIIGVVAGIAWMGFSGSMRGSGMFPLFGLLFIAVAVASGIKMIAKSGRFEQEQRDYEFKRAQLLHSREEPRNP